MQKFVQRCLVRIFRNERSRSTPLDPKLMVWFVSFRLGALEPFRYCKKLAAKHTKLVELMQKFVPRCLVRFFRNERSRSTPLDPKLIFGAFLSVWVHLEPFHYCTKLCAKWANLVQLMQEFVPQSLIRISQNRRSWSTQLDPKLMFSCVSFRLVHLGPLCYCTNLMQNATNWCN